MWAKEGRRSRNICVSTPETELLLSTPTGLLPKQLGWSAFYLQCINSLCSPFFWHYSDCLCNLPSPPQGNAAFLPNSWIAVCQPTDAFLRWNCCVLEKCKGRHLYLKENFSCWGFLKITIAMRGDCLSVQVFLRYSPEWGKWKATRCMEKSLNCPVWAVACFTWFAG